MRRKSLPANVIVLAERRPKAGVVSWADEMCRHPLPCAACDAKRAMRESENAKPEDGKFVPLLNELAASLKARRTAVKRSIPPWTDAMEKQFMGEDWEAERRTFIERAALRHVDNATKYREHFAARFARVQADLIALWIDSQAVWTDHMKTPPPGYD